MSYFYTNRDTYHRDDDSDTEDGSDIDSDTLEGDVFDKDITDSYKRITNPLMLRKIAQFIETSMRRSLKQHELMSIKNMIDNVINPSYSYRFDPTGDFHLQNLHKFSDKYIVKKIADKWLSEKVKRESEGCEPKVIDVHEMLRGEIGTTAESSTVSRPTFNQRTVQRSRTIPPQKVDILNILGLNSRHSILKLFNPRALISYNYVYLDSRIRNIGATDGVQNTNKLVKFQWDEDNTGNIEPGKFSYLGDIRDIIEIKVYPFRIPFPSDGSGDTGNRSITIFFEEFSNQMFIGRRRRFHIVTEVSIDGTWIYLDPYNSNNGIFKFDTPITVLNKLTVSFGNPNNPINFDKDRLLVTFTTGLPTLVTTSENHNLTTGDRVSFTDFTTLDPTGDASVIALMNDADGLVITVTGVTTFTVDIDTSTTTPDPTLQIICIFDSKTFQIPLQFTFIRAEENN